MHIGRYAFSNCESLEKINWPTALVTVGAKAFENTALRAANLPESVNAIGEGAFAHCENLAEVTLPSGLRSLPPRIFEKCIALKGIQLHEGLVDIGDSAFYGCTSLTTITFPVSLRSIGRCAFRGCRAVSGITFLDPNGWQYRYYLGSTLTDFDTADPWKNALYVTDFVVADKNDVGYVWIKK